MSKDNTLPLLGVSKCRLLYYSGMMRPTDQEVIDIERIVCYSFQVDGHTSPLRCTWGSRKVSHVGEVVREKCGQDLY